MVSGKWTAGAGPELRALTYHSPLTTYRAIRGIPTVPPPRPDPPENPDHDQADPGRLHRRRHPHPGRQGPAGVFRNTRPDDMLAHVLRAWSRRRRASTRTRIDDAIIGCAMPEGEQGMNVARIGVLLAGLPNTSRRRPSTASARPACRPWRWRPTSIRLGDADLMLAGGTESMSMVPMMGNKVAMNPACSPRTRTSPSPTAWASPPRRSPRSGRSARGPGRVRLASHQKAIAAIAGRRVRDEITPYEVVSHASPTWPATSVRRELLVDTDEGPRPTPRSRPGKLRPVFRNGQFGGSVTAGNSSQMSDGAGAVLLASEQAIKDYGLTPLARFVSFSVAGVRPKSWASARSRRSRRRSPGRPDPKDQLDWIELNEAFAAQALAVIRDLGSTRQGQPAGRRDRPGPPARRHRRDPHRDHRPRPAPAPAEVRHGDDVHRHRHGRRGHLRSSGRPRGTCRRRGSACRSRGTARRRWCPSRRACVRSRHRS
jgi:acetyl-CoA acyltransferase